MPLGDWKVSTSSGSLHSASSRHPWSFSGSAAASRKRPWPSGPCRSLARPSLVKYAVEGPGLSGQETRELVLECRWPAEQCDQHPVWFRELVGVDRLPMQLDTVQILSRRPSEVEHYPCFLHSASSSTSAGSEFLAASTAVFPRHRRHPPGAQVYLQVANLTRASGEAVSKVKARARATPGSAFLCGVAVLSEYSKELRRGIEAATGARHLEQLGGS